MDVSIVIVNYNTFDLTSACIRSVISRTQEVEYEIILVDNKSTDVDPQEFARLFPDLVLVASPANVGFSKGCNLGIAVAKGKYVLLLNSDTLLANDAVAIARSVLDTHADVAVVASRLEYPDGTAQHNCQRFPTLRYKLFEIFRLQKLLPARLAGRILFGFFFDYREVAHPDWVWGTFFMFRRSLLHELADGKLDDHFFMYVEDMEWCWQFRQLGYRVAFEPAAVVVHLMGKSGGEQSRLNRENNEYFLRKHYQPPHARLIKWVDTFLTMK